MGHVVLQFGSYVQGLVRASFHVGHSFNKFQVIVGWRCSHVHKHKLPTKRIMLAYQNVEGGGHEPLDFHAPTKTPLKCTRASHRRIKGWFQEEVSRWAKIWEDERSQLAHTPLDSIFFWVGRSLFPLESGGCAAYMETHSQPTHPFRTSQKNGFEQPDTTLCVWQFKQ